ncbi:hypothetical protein [Flavobacterium sp.]|uniref:hypothetical protein n=1 Tax=Flavobacterium sp. TaxID=239 RepID=UPI00333F1E3A
MKPLFIGLLDFLKIKVANKTKFTLEEKILELEKEIIYLKNELLLIEKFIESTKESSIALKSFIDDNTDFAKLVDNKFKNIEELYKMNKKNNELNSEIMDLMSKRLNSLQETIKIIVKNN